jgi:predicted nicotinamide N-methyase
MLIVNLLVLLAIIFLLLMLSAVWPPDSPWAPWWRTSKKTARAICRLAKVKKGDLIYDLGSGDGTALMIAAKEFGANGIGVEIDPFRYWVSKILLKKNSVTDRVKILRKNFFTQSIKDADVILCVKKFFLKILTLSVTEF